jgi:hydrogenase maturation protease
VSAIASRSSQLSLHEMSMSDALAYWTTAGLRAEQMVIIGVEPDTTDWGCELSATLQTQLATIVSAVIGEVVCERTEGHDSQQPETP